MSFCNFHVLLLLFFLKWQTCFNQYFFVVDRSALEVELQCAMKTAARDYIREWCIQRDQHARSQQEVLRNLRSQQQSILDFRQLVVRATEAFF